MIGNNFEADIKRYRARGETGFFFDWRKEHDGADVPNGYLQALRCARAITNADILVAFMVVLACVIVFFGIIG